MTGGFGAIPDTLRQTANSIGDVIGGVAGMVWRGPGGDYGHAGVQRGWAEFVEDMRGAVEKLHAKAEEHGENLKNAAISYLETDDGVGEKLAGIGEVIDDLDLGGDGPTGIMSPQRSRELFPQSSIDSRLNPDDDERV